MVSTTTQVKARSVTGEEVHLLANHTDSPLVNVQDLERKLKNCNKPQHRSLRCFLLCNAVIFFLGA